MNHFAQSYEIAYRHDQLRRVRQASKRSPVRQRRSRFARRRTMAEEASAPPMVLTVAVPALGTAEFHEWTTAVGQQFAERGVVAVKRQLDALTNVARHHGVATVAAAVLSDRRENEIARARAFLRVVSALGQLTPVTVDSLDVAA